MATPEQTCWTMVEGAAAGDEARREQFARAYLPIVRSSLAARWTGGALLADLDDAVQEALLECLKENGALQRIETPREGRFRTFLFAVVQNVARRFEEKASRRNRLPETWAAELPASTARLSRAFDQAWARTILRQAADRHRKEAVERGAEALRRVELMRLRFSEGLPIREIARRWNEDPARLHHEYAKGREEFKEALVRELAFHQMGGETDPDRACRELLELLP